MPLAASSDRRIQMLTNNPANSLSQLTIAGCDYVIDANSGKHIFHVNSPHALTQASGYLKYKYGKMNRSIFFRGQSKLYDALSPTLVRNIKNHSFLKTDLRIV
jgi:hypothetical protein